MTTTPGQGAATSYGDPLQVTPTPQTSGNPASSSSPPATEQAKHAAETTASEAKNVTGTAASEAKNVAGTAAAEAKDVAGEAKAQARDLVHEARTQVSEQSRTQRDRLTQALDQAAGELRSMAEYGGGDGVATEVVRQVATRAQDISSFLGRHEPGELVTEARRFARRRPGAFLLGAVVAGVVAGRMVKGASSSSGSQQQADGTSAGTTDGRSLTAAPAESRYPTSTPLTGASPMPTTTRLDQYETSPSTSSSPSGGNGQSTAGGRP